MLRPYVALRAATAEDRTFQNSTRRDDGIVKKRFSDLTEQEILALAISLEEEDARVYRDFSFALTDTFPATAEVFREMAKIETSHRRRLFEVYQAKFGDHIPLIRPQDVKGFVDRTPPWYLKQKGVEAMREHAALLELETGRFYQQALHRTHDASIRKLLGDLAYEEQHHEHQFEQLERELLPEEVRAEERETAHRLFVLQVIQPGLAGLMDGSVSTLAPLFAAAFATQSTHDALIVGFAASIGAGISMGFAEALSDDGSLTGRGRPLLRGVVCGAMTTVGGLGHTLPYLLPNFWLATVIAIIIVVIELLTIAWIRHRYMDTPLLSAGFQVVLGGVLVFLAGVLIGQA